jgi:nucleotide-binding universal stress UspA family protein
MRVLIGYDSSPSAEAALEELKKAGLPRETEIVVVTAGEIWMPPPNVEMRQTAMLSRRASVAMAQIQTEAELTLQQAKETADEAADQIKRDFPEWLVETEAMGGEAAAAIIRKAAEWPADLIVVGSQNRSTIGRLFLGSVSQKVILEAGCSVRVARGSAAVEKGAPRRMIAGIDDTDTAEAIIETIAARVWPRGSVLRIVTATDTFSELAKRPFKEIIKAQDFHTAVQERLASSGLKLLASINVGDAREELLAEARKLHADCIFVGTRDIRGTLNRFFINSVSSGVVKDAECSVEVVRARAI